MKIFNKLPISIIGSCKVLSGLLTFAGAATYSDVWAFEKSSENKRPNILWITSEDNSPSFVGAYGNKFATTPNIDKLAREGFMYTHAYAAHPVCSPSRNSIITGVYANSNGNMPMRSAYPTSDKVHTYPEYLRQAGYYVSNCSKTDYNSGTINEKAIWDDCSPTAHYKNRAEGQPFFAVFNLMESHESQLSRRFGTPYELLHHKPEDVVLAPYHPDIPEMRNDWSYYYDAVENMDSYVGKLLNELDYYGLAENTIVIYCSDHGGVLSRSKRFVYDTGTDIPLVVRIPDKYKYIFPSDKPGDKVDRMVSLVDLPPTLLSIAGIPVPDYMQGVPFLGKQKAEESRYEYSARGRMDERYDNSRTVVDHQYRYIHNDMPFRPAMQFLRTLFEDSGTLAWYNEFKAGKTNTIQSAPFKAREAEELYDIKNDPWNVNNLAGVPAYQDVLKRMRQAEKDWRTKIRDTGLIPEDEYSFYSGENTPYKSMYDYMHSDECPFDELMEAANLATEGAPEDLERFVTYLKSEHSGIRYWGVTGLLLLKNHAKPAIQVLKEAAYDRAGSVATLSAEALFWLGEKEAAMKAYVNILNDRDRYDYIDRNWALNSIDIIDETNHEIASPEIRDAIKKLVEYRNEHKFSDSSADYEMRTAMYILKSWGIEVEVAKAYREFGGAAPQGIPQGASHNDFGVISGGRNYNTLPFPNN